MPQRDQANYVLDTPVVELTKGVERIVRGVTTVDGPNGADVDARTVKGGDEVTYRVDVSNTRRAGRARRRGLGPAAGRSTRARAASSAISDCGACAHLEPRRVDHPHARRGRDQELTYTATVPADVGPGRTLDNNAGVHAFEGATNLGSRFSTARPTTSTAQRRRPTRPPPTTTAVVTVAAATVAKVRSTSVTESGNNRRAGDDRRGNHLHGHCDRPGGDDARRRRRADRHARQRPPASRTSAARRPRRSTAAALPGTFTLDTGGAVPRVVFPGGYANAPGSGDDVVVLGLHDLVANVGANTAASGNAHQQRRADLDRRRRRSADAHVADGHHPGRRAADHRRPRPTTRTRRASIPARSSTYTVTTSNSSAGRTSRPRTTSSSATPCRSA